MWSPAESVGTRMRLRERDPPWGSIRTRVMMKSAMLAFVHHIFEPLITHAPSSNVAFVRTPPLRSEPAPGSVSANAAN